MSLETLYCTDSKTDISTNIHILLNVTCSIAIWLPCAAKYVVYASHGSFIKLKLLWILYWWNAPLPWGIRNRILISNHSSTRFGLTAVLQPTYPSDIELSNFLAYCRVRKFARVKYFWKHKSQIKLILNIQFALNTVKPYINFQTFVSVHC